MRILGVDPGTLAVGFGVVDKNGSGCRAIDFGCIKISSKMAFPSRLKKIYDEISGIISEYQPAQFAVEDVFYAENVKVALKMGHARGVALLAAVNQAIPTAEYSPREIKQSVVGNGAASKEQVQRMLQHLLLLREPPKPFDASDALAVALCHSHRMDSRI
ncbi:crossover junction endodeoxyribonuclease RuvC [bacterium]|nr:crossover junction endodeoxyribonuclease RuvC [bacterium]